MAHVEPVEPWESVFTAISNHCAHTGPVVEPIGCLECAEIADEVVSRLPAPDAHPVVRVDTSDPATVERIARVMYEDDDNPYVMRVYREQARAILAALKETPQ